MAKKATAEKATAEKLSCKELTVLIGEIAERLEKSVEDRDQRIVAVDALATVLFGHEVKLVNAIAIIDQLSGH